LRANYLGGGRKKFSSNQGGGRGGGGGDIFPLMTGTKRLWPAVENEAPRGGPNRWAERGRKKTRHVEQKEKITGNAHIVQAKIQKKEKKGNF